MAKKGPKTGSSHYSDEQKQKVIELYCQGIAASKICTQLHGSIPLRTIKEFIHQYKQDKLVNESVQRLVESKVLDITLASTINAIATRRQWLFDYAMKIWDKLPESERYTSRMFIKFIEFAQKDDELLLKPLMVPEGESSAPSTSAMEKSLEEKLGLLNEPDAATQPDSKLN
jgi:transposase-like protein